MKIEQSQWSPANGWTPSLTAFSLGETAQVVFVFGSAPPEEMRGRLREVGASFPNARVFGCSTGGEIHDVRVDDGTISLTAIEFAETRIAAASAPIDGVERSFAAGEALVRQFDPNGLRHLFVLSEGLAVNGSDLVEGINAALPDGVTVSGGFASDGNRLQATFVWCDDELRQSSVVALGFYGERLRIGVSATSGWGPFGPDRLITKSNKNVLYEFDGRPALALYKQYLGDYAADLPASGLMFPLDLRIGERRNCVLRALLAVDEKEQSITFAGNVPEGSYARLMMGHIEDLIGGTCTAAEGSLRDLGAKEAEFSLLVSCNARRAVLKQRVEEEVETVRDVFGSRTAFTGFYSYGEIAPLEGGGRPELHNETMTITSFAEG